MKSSSDRIELVITRSRLGELRVRVARRCAGKKKRRGDLNHVEALNVTAFPQLYSDIKKFCTCVLKEDT